MLTEADMIEAINYYRAGDDDKLLELFQRFDFYDWETPECNEWKKHHAQEFSDFIQYVMAILPTTSTPMINVLALCDNYIDLLAHVPAAPDLAIQMIVDFWNRKRAAEEEDVASYLALLRKNPDGKRVAEIAQGAIGSANKLQGDGHLSANPNH